MSETTPLNEWPVEKLYFLKSVVKNHVSSIELDLNKIMILSIIESAIKDAEEKLNELPFK